MIIELASLYEQAIFLLRLTLVLLILALLAYAIIDYKKNHDKYS